MQLLICISVIINLLLNSVESFVEDRVRATLCQRFNYELGICRQGSISGAESAKLAPAAETAVNASGANVNSTTVERSVAAATQAPDLQAETLRPDVRDRLNNNLLLTWLGGDGKLRAYDAVLSAAATPSPFNPFAAQQAAGDPTITNQNSAPYYSGSSNQNIDVAKGKYSGNKAYDAAGVGVITGNWGVDTSHLPFLQNAMSPIPNDQTYMLGRK
uniref:Uncharacterized protein n=1 Tax=Romanomermis culicivorax TaxID=13658 RepID=A0A915JS28_ROMCU